MIFGRKEKVTYEDFQDYRTSEANAQYGDKMIRSPFPNGIGAVFVSRKRVIDQVPGRNDRIRYYDIHKDRNGFSISGIGEGQWRFNSWKELLVQNGFWKDYSSIEEAVA